MYAVDALFFVQNGTLYRYELPSGPEVSRDFSSEENNTNSDLVFDEVNQKLYWVANNDVRSIPADFNSTTPFTTEFSANNGSNGTPLGARGLSIDGVNNKAYIGEISSSDFINYTQELVSYDMNNANPVSTRTVLHSFSSNKDISSTVVDADNNRVYWVQLGTEIGYVDLNGNSPTTLLSLPSSDLFTIRKDPTSERIIFTNANNTTPGIIGAISTSGGSVTTLYTTNPPASSFIEVRALAILGNGDTYFTPATISFSGTQSIVFLKGNNSSAPMSTSSVIGTSFSSSSLVYFLAAGSFGTVVPSVTISATTASVSENSGTSLVYRLTRTEDNSATLTVNFSISGTSADNDYTVVAGGTGSVTYNSTNNTGTITFPANSATVDLTVTPTADVGIEADETVIVTVDNP